MNNKNKKFGKPKKNPVNPDNAKISEILTAQSGRVFSFPGIIDRIAQTTGPTVFYINDGTGTLVLKSFQGAGERAYAEIVEGDAVQAIVRLEEFQEELEGDIISFRKLTSQEKTHLEKEISEIERKRAAVEPVEFLIKSQILDKLKDRYIKAATEIRLAIIQNRPIIIRHHNDTDGYSSGYTLERAILPLIRAQHNSEKAAWEFFMRAPCAAPMYEIDDSLRDTANSLRNVAKFSNKMPLIIIADNGSTEQDLLAIQHGKVHGMDFIVVDHHFFDKDVISEKVLVHINPFLVKEDGSSFSAGMLCTELARFINPDVKNIAQIPAMAGIADMIYLNNPKAIEEYTKIAEKEGYTKELLGKISKVIDFVSAKVRFMEAREYFEVLFGEPRNKQKHLVDLMAPYIEKLESKGLELGKSYSKKEKIGKITLQSIEIDKVLPPFNFYPKTGRIVSMIHDFESSKNKIALVSIGILSSAITIRATDSANFSVHELIDYLNKKVPEAFIEGGGHKNAGSINFIPIKQQDVLIHFKDYLKTI